MDVFDAADLTERVVADFGSAGAHWTSVVHSASTCHVGRMRIEPGGMVGIHPTRIDQLFLVVDGQGWVRVGGGTRRQVRAGDAVLWRAGEVHESGTDAGMTAIVVQAAELIVGD